MVNLPNTAWEVSLLRGFFSPLRTCTPRPFAKSCKIAKRRDGFSQGSVNALSLRSLGPPGIAVPSG
jgi:hypothetical protein